MECSCGHVHNNSAKPSISQSLRSDPSKTAGIRRAFENEMKRRFRQLKQEIINKVVNQDVFGLRKPTVLERDFQFMRDDKKLEAFLKWLREMKEQNVLELVQRPGSFSMSPWANTYIWTAYQKGIQRAGQELRARGYNVPKGEMGTTAPIQVGLNQPMNAEVVYLIYSRVYSELKGITEAMEQQISRVLALGLAEGRNPEQIAVMITEKVDGIGLVRARMLARTETIAAHHQATINTYEQWGVSGVSVQAEWLTVGDNKVCPRCAGLNRKVFTLKEIRNMIPAHPNCRCVAIPTLPTDLPPVRKGKKKAVHNAGFDSSQPRDEHGRWVNSGGGSEVYGDVEQSLVSVLPRTERVFKKEKAVLLGADGNQYVVHGKRHEVDLKDLPPEALFNAPVMVHTHPHSFMGYEMPPSPQDLILAVHKQIKKSVVVSGKHAYIFSDFNPDWTFDDMEREFKDSESRSYNKVLGKARKDEVSLAQASIQYMNGVWYDMSEKGAFKYTIVPLEHPINNAGFDPNQPRDEDGKWSESGATGAAKSIVSKGVEFVKKHPVATAGIALAGVAVGISVVTVAGAALTAAESNALTATLGEAIGANSGKAGIKHAVRWLSNHKNFLKREIGLVLDKEGNWYAVAGAKKRVAIPLDLVKKTDTMIHNHPRLTHGGKGIPFSETDIKNMLKYKTRQEIVVSGEDVFIAYPGPKILPESELAALIPRFRKASYHEASEHVLSGKGKLSDLSYHIYDNFMKKLHNEGIVIYDKMKIWDLDLGDLHFKG